MAIGTDSAVIIKHIRIRTFHRIRNVALVVGAVQIDAIPAGRERNDAPNPSGAELLGQGHAIGSSAVQVPVVPGLGHAAVAHFRVDFPLICRAPESGVADEHAEAGLEGSRLVRAQWGNVVNSDAADALQALARLLRDSSVGPVPSAEVEHCGPVVGEVLGKGARGAARLGHEIVRLGIH